MHCLTTSGISATCDPDGLGRYNVVDTVIIALSLAALGPLNLPISVMRIIRAFRVVRCVWGDSEGGQDDRRWKRGRVCGKG